LAELIGTREQIVLFYGVDHGTANPASQWISAKRGSMVARLDQFPRRTAREAGADRETIAERFCQADHVGFAAAVLMGEPGAGSAHAGLNFIQYRV
jgi:hypothetical protein